MSLIESLAWLIGGTAAIVVAILYLYVFLKIALPLLIVAAFCSIGGKGRRR